MAEKAWKRAERAVARKLGGERVPITGRARGDAPDVDAGWCVAEVKHRKRLPLWLTEALAQAEAAAKDGQVPVAILHQAGDAYDSALCVVRLRDLAKLAPVATEGDRGVKSLGPHRP